MKICHTCNKYIHRGVLGYGRHVCPPLWDVWEVDGERGDFRPVRARDAEDAATEWADQVDSGGDYWIAESEGDGIEVLVAPAAPSPGQEMARRFRVFGERTIDYSAMEIL